MNYWLPLTVARCSIIQKLTHPQSVKLQGRMYECLPPLCSSSEQATQEPPEDDYEMYPLFLLRILDNGLHLQLLHIAAHFLDNSLLCFIRKFSALHEVIFRQK